MKCRNCGAHYKTRELKCPYCDTENFIGRIWLQEKSAAELEYEAKRRELGKTAPLYVINRVLTRTILISVLILILGMVIVTGVFAVQMLYGRLYKDANSVEIAQQMDEYYENAQYEELDAYLDEYDLFGTELYKYSQAALLWNIYNSYITRKLLFLELSDERKAKDTYYLEYSIRDSAECYTLDLGLYSELDPENEELYNYIREDVMAFWVGVLELTPEEIESITADTYISYDVSEQLAQTVKERKGWVN